MLFGLLALSLTNYLLRFVRWGRYLALLDAPLPWRINLDAYFSGFALTTSPGKVGEMLRSVLLKRHGVPPAASIAAFWVWRRFSASSKMMLRGLSRTACSTSSPAWAGRQCMK